MRFGDHRASWSFDSTNAYCAKQSCGEFLSTLYVCGTPASDFFAAELIYRELISNTSRHTPGQVEVELLWTQDYLILNVEDQSDLFFWTGELPLNPLNDHGRGLYLVKTLARSLQIKSVVGEGSKISAVLPVARKFDLANLFDFSDLPNEI